MHKAKADHPAFREARVFDVTGAQGVSPSQPDMNFYLSMVNKAVCAAIGQIRIPSGDGRLLERGPGGFPKSPNTVHSLLRASFRRAS